MAKWEYRVVYYAVIDDGAGRAAMLAVDTQHGPIEGEASNFLNDYGEEEWELVAVSPFGGSAQYTFKREKKNPPGEKNVLRAL